MSYRFAYEFRTPSQDVADSLAAWSDDAVMMLSLDPNGPENHELATVSQDAGEWVCAAEPWFETPTDARAFRDAFNAKMAEQTYLNPNACTSSLTED